jgi:cytochrome P450
VDARFDTGLDAWVLSSYADVYSALRDRRLTVHGEPESNAARDVRVAVRRTPLTRDQLSEWRARLEQSAGAMVEALPRSTPVDLMKDFAAPWALLVATIAGETGADDDLAALARTVFADAATSMTGEPTARAREAAAALATELSARGAIDVQSFVALSQSVPAFLAASWLELFRTHAEFDDISTAVDELLRFAGPSRAVFRRARADAQIGQAPIEAGQRVVLMLASANRDPAKFPDPDRLDFARDASDHLAFGHGSHSCVGASLVRMAVVAATNALLAVTRNVSIVDAQWLDGFAIRAPSSLVVTLND